MKSNELRIGSWVETYDCEQNQLLIEDFALMYERNLDADEYCKPIPLTEEWLLKFGFIAKDICDEGGFLYNDWFIEVNLNNTIDWSGFKEALTYPYEHIKYVHQLQNLYFALTGEELKTKE